MALLYPAAVNLSTARVKARPFLLRDKQCSRCPMGRKQPRKLQDIPPRTKTERISPYSTHVPSFFYGPPAKAVLRPGSGTSVSEALLEWEITPPPFAGEHESDLVYLTYFTQNGQHEPITAPHSPRRLYTERFLVFLLRYGPGHPG
jgi:hypothetical protein